MAIVWLLYAQRYGIYAYSESFWVFFVKFLRKTPKFPAKAMPQRSQNEQPDDTAIMRFCLSVQKFTGIVSSILRFAQAEARIFSR